MDTKKEAAFHEASHAVIAHKSKFHNIIGPINLLKYGAGEVFVSLSKSKCVLQGKPANEVVALNREVATELAVILCAGLMGEMIASESDKSLIPNPKCSDPDHNLAKQQLNKAGLSKKYDHHQESAKALLRNNWNCVEKLALHLTTNGSADVETIIAIIESA